MKHLLIAAFMLLSGYSYAQHLSNAYGAPESHQNLPITSKTPGLTDLMEQKDSITGSVFYFDPRTAVDNIHGDGIFATIFKRSGQYALRFIAYHVAPGPVMVNGFGGNVATPVDITGVFIKTSDSLFSFEDPLQIQCNGSNFPHVIVNGDEAYNVLTDIVKCGYAKLHFESLPQLEDDILSNREISEIAMVVKDWKALNKIN